MENLKRCIAAYDEARDLLHTEMTKLHELKMQYRQTGLGEAEIVEQTAVTESAMKHFNVAYDNYLALYRSLE